MISRNRGSGARANSLSTALVTSACVSMIMSGSATGCRLAALPADCT
jgi:hypothetical protein